MATTRYEHHESHDTRTRLRVQGVDGADAPQLSAAAQAMGRYGEVIKISRPTRNTMVVKFSTHEQARTALCELQWKQIGGVYVSLDWDNIHVLPSSTIERSMNKKPRQRSQRRYTPYGERKAQSSHRKDGSDVFRRAGRARSRSPPRSRPRSSRRCSASPEQHSRRDDVSWRPEGPPSSRCDSFSQGDTRSRREEQRRSRSPAGYRNSGGYRRSASPKRTYDRHSRSRLPRSSHGYPKPSSSPGYHEAGPHRLPGHVVVAKSPTPPVTPDVPPKVSTRGVLQTAPVDPTHRDAHLTAMQFALAKEGQRITAARYLSDGAAIDWLKDNTVRDEKTEHVLHVSHPAAGHCSGQPITKQEEDPARPGAQSSSLLSFLGEEGMSEACPISIDSDDEQDNFRVMLTRQASRVISITAPSASLDWPAARVPPLLPLAAIEVVSSEDICEESVARMTLGQIPDATDGATASRLAGDSGVSDCDIPMGRDISARNSSAALYGNLLRKTLSDSSSVCSGTDRSDDDNPRENPDRPSDEELEASLREIRHGAVLSLPGPSQIKPHHREQVSSSSSSSDDSDRSGAVVPGTSQARRLPVRRRANALRPDHRPSCVNENKVLLAKKVYARARRLLVPDDDDLPLVCVNMRGDTQFVDRNHRTRMSLCSINAREDDLRHVVDACMLGDHVVLAYDDNTIQLSLIPLQGLEEKAEKPPGLRDISHRAHSTVHERTNHPARRNRGPRCLGSVDETRLLSGGYDSFVYLWTLSPDLTMRSERVRGTDHSSAVAAVAADLPTVYSAASKNLHATDLATGKLITRLTRSNEIYQIHSNPSNPKTIFLEVDNVDEQVELLDLRIGGPARRTLAFGHPIVASSKKRRGFADTRFSRGAVCSTGTFARGYSDYCLKVWDCRSTKRAVLRADHNATEQVIHCAFERDSREVVAFGGHVVSFWNLDEADQTCCRSSAVESE